MAGGTGCRRVGIIPPLFSNAPNRCKSYRFGDGFRLAVLFDIGFLALQQTARR